MGADGVLLSVAAVCAVVTLGAYALGRFVRWGPGPGRVALWLMVPSGPAAAYLLFGPASTASRALWGPPLGSSGGAEALGGFVMIGMTLFMAMVAMAVAAPLAFALGRRRG